MKLAEIPEDGFQKTTDRSVERNAQGQLQASQKEFGGHIASLDHGRSISGPEWAFLKELGQGGYQESSEGGPRR